MSVEAMVPIAPVGVERTLGDTRLQQAGTSFSTWLTGEIEQVNRQILEADTQVRKLAVGEAVNLHQVMMALEKAKLSFELVTQVRNKLLDAYQDVMRMQI